MADDEKAKLYRRISGARHHVVLERMRVHGFWPAGQGLPPAPPEEVEERKKIDAEVGALRARSAGKGPLVDAEEELKKERKRRWEESKKRRSEKKKLREARAAERRAAWAAEKKDLLVHAGEGVSGGLQELVSDVEALTKRGLPVLHTPTELAAAIGIPISRLRWLTFHRRGATLVHYHRYGIPKKTGGIRAISAPKPALARAQQWVLGQILARLAAEPEAHGFVPGRSIVSNAAPHVNKAVVVNLDLKDFFPTLTFARVKGLFVAFGYGEAVATCLALLCTEPPRVAVDLDGRAISVAIGARVLPQGACTSPAITNLACRRLDRRLAGVARKYGFSYTRYADDLTFSRDAGDGVGGLLRAVRAILADEGFAEHPEKTHVMRRGRRQEVTGVTVNEKTGVSRAELRELRAILHNAARFGLASQNRHDHPHFAAYLRGRVAYVTMVDPSKREQLQVALANALERR
jgi:retron-type reverse transcriptase